MIIVNNDNDKILLVKRAKKDDEFPDTWSLPGGGPEINETIEEALKREIKEEINCDIVNFLFFKSKYLIIKEDFHARALYFYGTVEGDIKLEESELSDYKWFDINKDLLNLNFAFNQEDIIKDFIEFHNRN